MEVLLYSLTQWLWTFELSIKTACPWIFSLLSKNSSGGNGNYSMESSSFFPMKNWMACKWFVKSISCNLSNAFQNDNKILKLKLTNRFVPTCVMYILCMTMGGNWMGSFLWRFFFYMGGLSDFIEFFFCEARHWKYFEGVLKCLTFKLWNFVLGRLKGYFKCFNLTLRSILGQLQNQISL